MKNEPPTSREQTTVTIDPDVKRRAKAEADRRRISLSRYLEILADEATRGAVSA